MRINIHAPFKVKDNLKKVINEKIEKTKYLLRTHS